MNQSSFIRTLLIPLLFLYADMAGAANFQLKGASLGVSAASVCGISKITNNFNEIIKKYKTEPQSLVDMETTECEVDYASFGGSRLDKPANLLFLNDKLIVLKLELAGLPLSNFVDIYKALVEDYGKSQRSKSAPFVTDTWKRNGETLTLERLGREWDDNDVSIILRQDSGYRTYQTRYKANAAALEKLDAQKTKKDMR